MAFPRRIDPGALGPVALKQIESQGLENFSLRGVAKALGVTPNALYRHAGSREGLLVVAAAEAARDLTSTLEQHCRGEGIDQVLSLAKTYVDFAHRRPHAYRVFMEVKPDLDDQRVQPWRDLFRLVHTAISAVLPHAADSATFAFWALLHGRMELARGPARAVSADVGLEDAVRALMTGFDAIGPVASPLPPHLTAV